MLKACWDCLMGPTANRDQAVNEDSYGIRLNGDTQRAPPWPIPKNFNEKMFILPRKLMNGDKIRVAGRMTENRQSLVANLLTENYGSPDYENIACQIDVRFRQEEDTIYVKTIQNGAPETPPGYSEEKPDDFFQKTEFEFNYLITYGDYSGPSLEIYIGESFFCNVPLKHPVDNIRYLSIHGDVQTVNRLDFEFGS